MTHEHAPVLFCAAAGPRVGFGHLSRARALARALEVPLHVALRGTPATAKVAASFGAVVWPAGSDPIARLSPKLVVVDDPCQESAQACVDGARRHAVPVASVHDLGLAVVRSDLVIDGSIVVPDPSSVDLAGPSFAILDPSISGWRKRGLYRSPSRVLIALGGGSHVRWFGRQLAAGIARAIPGVEIVVAAGFGSGPRPELSAGARWIDASRGLASELTHCAVAVLSGGVTLYEGCALGTPIAAVAVASSQRPTIRGFAAVDAVLDAGAVWSSRAVGRVASNVKTLLERPQYASAIATRARARVDARGVFRVASALEALMSAKEQRHAA